MANQLAHPKQLGLYHVLFITVEPLLLVPDLVNIPGRLGKLGKIGRKKPAGS